MACGDRPSAERRGDGRQGEAPRIRLKTIIQAVCAEFEVDRAAMIGRRRLAGLVLARHVAAYLCLELTEASLGAVALALGRADHSTILHARRRIAGLLESAPDVRIRVERLRARLRQPDSAPVLEAEAQLERLMEQALDTVRRALRRDPVGTLADLAARFGDAPRLAIAPLPETVQPGGVLGGMGAVPAGAAAAAFQSPARPQVRPPRKPAKRRACLSCGGDFVSEGAHHRVCDSCKSGPDWRHGGGGAAVALAGY